MDRIDQALANQILDMGKLIHMWGVEDASSSLNSAKRDYSANDYNHAVDSMTDCSERIAKGTILLHLIALDPKKFRFNLRRKKELLDNYSHYRSLIEKGIGHDTPKIFHEILSYYSESTGTVDYQAFQAFEKNLGCDEDGILKNLDKIKYDEVHAAVTAALNQIKTSTESSVGSTADAMLANSGMFNPVAASLGIEKKTALDTYEKHHLLDLDSDVLIHTKIFSYWYRNSIRYRDNPKRIDFNKEEYRWFVDVIPENFALFEKDIAILRGISRKKD